jgi:hypothetical protein
LKIGSKWVHERKRENGVPSWQIIIRKKMSTSRTGESDGGAAPFNWDSRRDSD